jgi:protein-S-isoprenylcysteine O-methyltransferase Ste14
LSKAKAKSTGKGHRRHRTLAQRLRVPLGFVLGILYLVFARPTPVTLAVGGLIALGGVLVRAWAAGHIMKNEQLATSGPYAHTRNPLYFGSFLIAAGFAVALHWSALLLVIALFAGVYTPVMQRERGNIRRKFPLQYQEYERNVPMLLPRPTPWRGPDGREAGAFSFDLYMRHKEWRAALAYAGAILFLAIRMRYFNGR